jgi:murein DD-endopeptidase MepM/ murein hydrolase activator NlpD
MQFDRRVRVAVAGIMLIIKGHCQPMAIHHSNLRGIAVSEKSFGIIKEERLRNWIATTPAGEVVAAYASVFIRAPELAQTIPCLPPLGDWSGNRITSGFGVRTHPTLHTQRHHDGIDIAGPNQYVRAAASGRVVVATYSSSLGQYVRLDHGNSYQTVYGHLALSSVRAGQWVRIGETLGITGSTGRSTGVHLHYSVLKHNVPVNPADYLLLAIRFVQQYQQLRRAGQNRKP